MNTLRVGSGRSVRPDAAEAGRAAATDAMAALSGEPAALVLVYATAAYDLTHLVAGVREITGATPLAGASTSGQFAGGVLQPPGSGVAVLALTAGPYRFGVASVTGLREQPFESGREVARAAMAAAGPDRSEHGALMVISDGVTADPQGMLNGIYRVTGASVPVVGGAASAVRELQGTLVFHDERVLADGAVAVWIDSPHPLRVAAAHGWRANSMPLLVTRSDGLVVEELGGRPAYEVYLEHFRRDDVIDGRDEGGVGWYSAHAFGLVEPDGSQLIRAVAADDNHVLRSFAPLPPYCAIQVMSGRADELLDVVEPVVEEVVADRTPSVLLVFDCVARYDILGPRADEEVKRLGEAAAGAEVFGFFTYGEFARTTSVSGYHNATVAALAL
jgi:hypothetical protein